MNIKLLALDPSSTCVGWALLHGPDVRQIHVAGKIKPRSQDKPLKRLSFIHDSICELYKKYTPTHTAIEVPSGHVGNRHRGRGAGLSVYGMAVGAAWCLANQQSETYAVNENDWTGSVSKEKRAHTLRLMSPLYCELVEMQGDSGFDIADAMGIGLYVAKRIQFESIANAKAS